MLSNKPQLSDSLMAKTKALSDQCLWIRWYYENLIESGKLKVVKESGYIPADTWACYCTCRGCGEPCSETGDQTPYPYCPYCGNKIIK
jgi:hypothetical protein